MTDLEQAKGLLKGEITCVLYKEGGYRSSTRRGVKPLVDWVKSGADFNGFSAADKVVGKGAAFLYLLLGVKAVYAGVISQSAYALLKNRGVFVEYGTLVENIINRTGDGICPFEEAVLQTDNPQTAYEIIEAKLLRLQANVKKD